MLDMDLFFQAAQRLASERLFWSQNVFLMLVQAAYQRISYLKVGLHSSQPMIDLVKFL